MVHLLTHLELHCAVLTTNEDFLSKRQPLYNPLSLEQLSLFIDLGLQSISYFCDTLHTISPAQVNYVFHNQAWSRLGQCGDYQSAIHK